MPLTKFPPAGTAVLYKGSSYEFTARLDKNCRLSGAYAHGIIIDDIMKTWHGKDINFGLGDLSFMSIISEIKIPSESDQICKNGKQATFTIKKL